MVSDFLRPHESQHARPPCPSSTPRIYPNSCPLSWWWHPASSSSVVPFYSCPQSLPASGSFPVSQLFAWSGQSIGVSLSASVLPMNTQDWSPLGWTGLISLLSKELSIVFASITVWKHHRFFNIFITIMFKVFLAICNIWAISRSLLTDFSLNYGSQFPVSFPV